MLKQDKATWTIMGCTLHKLRFGQESDLPLRKEDKLRGIVPMPVTCKDWGEYGDQKTKP
jgi:hypothetical protein